MVFEICKETFSSDGELKNMETSDQSSLEAIEVSSENGASSYFQCPKCPFRREKVWKVEHHLKAHMDEKPFKCDYSNCKFATNYAGNLNIHVEVHRRKELGQLLKCSVPDCSHQTFSTGSMSQHHKSCHIPDRPRDFKCTFCYRSFHTSGNRNAHLKVHVTERPVKCDFCDYGSKNRYYLRRHIENKHGVLNTLEADSKTWRFRCEKCEYHTNFKEKWDRHIANHSNLKPFACPHPGCNYRARRSDVIKRHEVCHLPHQQIRCPVEGCDFLSKDRYAARYHAKCHKYFQCQIPGCNVLTARQAGLKKHMDQFHNPNKKIQCPLCPKKFATSVALGAHVPFHTGERNFKCSFCDYVAVTGSNIRQHERRVHNKGSTGSKHCRDTPSRMAKTPENSALISKAESTSRLRCKTIFPPQLNGRPIGLNNAVVLLDRMNFQFV